MPFDFEEILSRVRTNDPALTHLSLPRKQLTDENIIELCSALAANTTLKSLQVSDNRIGDAGAQALAANTTLKSLSVGFNRIGDVNLRLLQDAIIRNKHTIMGLDAFASIANGKPGPNFLPAEIAKYIGSFLITGTEGLNEITQRAVERSSRHLLFHSAVEVHSTIEPIQPAATNG